MLTRHDVGHRVSVRWLVGERDRRPVYSDLVGVLVEMTDTSLRLRTDRGPVEVPRGAVNAAKRVPDRRPFTATERLERVAADGWPAPDREQLGDWLLRAAAGWTARGNSALPVGRSDRTLPEAVDAVVAWYAARDLPPAIMVPEPVGGRLTAELRARGWVPDPLVLMQTADLPAIVAAGRPAVEVRLDEAPDAAWLDVVRGRKGSLPASARQIITGVPRSRFAGVYRPDGTPVAIARGVVAGDGEWLGLSLIEVDPAARRRGLATAVCAALAGWAADEAAHRAYLQVEAHNAGAVALYARLGFTTHHRYATWRPAPHDG